MAEAAVLEPPAPAEAPAPETPPPAPERWHLTRPSVSFPFGACEV